MSIFLSTIFLFPLWITIASLAQEANGGLSFKASCQLTVGKVRSLRGTTNLGRLNHVSQNLK